MGVRNTRASIRSHKRQSGSKAESIWLRFSEGRNRKDFAGSVFYGLRRQSEALAAAFLFKVFKLAQEVDGIGKGEGYVSRRLPHLMNL